MTPVECPYCERRCKLQGQSVGYCHLYEERDGTVVERFPHRYSSMFVNHIENIPFYHFQPGSRTFTLGGAGCNFDCQYCSNAFVARSEPEPLLSYHLSPERVVTLAKQYGCHNLAYAINEPTVAMPTLLEVASAAGKAGMPLGALTNGYMTAESAREMGRAFRFVNISLKGLSDQFYRDYVGVPSHEVVLRNIEILRRLTHIEVSTPVVEGVNDGDIMGIARFLASIDRRIPWHVFRLLPEYRMAEQKRPSIENVNRSLVEARRLLPFVYFENFVGSQWVSTLCPHCGNVAIERLSLGGCGSKTRSYNVRDGCCGVCGEDLALSGGLIQWHSKDGEPWMSA